jgi:hypothetical protein
MRHHVTNLCKLLLTMLSFPTLQRTAHNLQRTAHNLQRTAHNLHGHALYRSTAQVARWAGTRYTERTHSAGRNLHGHAH